MEGIRSLSTKKCIVSGVSEQLIVTGIAIEPLGSIRTENGICKLRTPYALD
jgi:hypothetical protein